MAEVYWTGGAGAEAPASGDYRDAGNWSDGRIPGKSDRLILSGTGYDVTLREAKNDFVVAKQIELGAGTRFTVADHRANPEQPLTFYVNGMSGAGALMLEGGKVTTFALALTPGSLVEGWGTLDAQGYMEGDIVASRGGDGRLAIGSESGQLEFGGSLSGAGTAVIRSMVLDGGSSVTVRTLDIVGSLSTDADLDLTRSHFVSDGGRVSILDHVLTIDGGLLNGFTFWNGTLVNQGRLVVTQISEVEDRFVNDGKVALTNGGAGFLVVTAAVGGHGSFELEQDGRLEFDGSVGEGQTVGMASGSTLTLGSQGWAGFDGSIHGFDQRDAITLLGFDQAGVETTATYLADKGGRSGTLTLAAGDASASLHLVGRYDASGFSTDVDAAGNVDLHYEPHLPHTGGVVGV